MEYEVHGSYNVCQMGRNCCQYFAVEYNGDIFPCDFYIEKDLLIGNIHNISWKSALESEAYKKFGRNKSKWQKECGQCDVLTYCSGDCLKHRKFNSIDNTQKLSHLCAGQKSFLNHSISGFKMHADEIRQKEKYALLQDIVPIKSHRPGRNDPCPCGSGKKYKKCCGNK